MFLFITTHAAILNEVKAKGSSMKLNSSDCTHTLKENNSLGHIYLLS